MVSWVRRNPLVVGYAILAAFVFAGFVRQQNISDERKTDLAKGQRAIISAQVDACHLDHRFREQYKVRGTNLKTLAKILRHQIKQSERSLKDPAVKAAFPKKLLVRSHRQNRNRIKRLNSIIGTTHILPVENCGDLRHALESHLNVP